MASAWQRLSGHKGIEFRQYDGGVRSYRFRQHPYGTDFLGVMPEEKAIRIAGELRENRAVASRAHSMEEMELLRAITGFSTINFLPARTCNSTA